MTQAAIDLGEATDSELIGLVRAGEASAYAALYDRHREPALRLAHSLTSADRAQDLVSEAFAKVLDVLGRGLGPNESFRAYLFTTVRNVHLNAIRSGQRERLVDDYEASGADLAVDDGLDGLADRSAIARAFKRLPERWATVLWLTAVENRPLHDVGRLMGIEPNAVAALSHRAREGLRQAYLADHLAEATDLTCREACAALPAYLRGSLTARKRSKVDAHLDECPRCAAAVVELGEINNNLGALLGPLVLAGLAGGALTSGSPAAVGAVINGPAVLRWARRVLDQGRSFTGVAAVSVVTLALVGSSTPGARTSEVDGATVPIRTSHPAVAGLDTGGATLARPAPRRMTVDSPTQAPHTVAADGSSDPSGGAAAPPSSADNGSGPDADAPEPGQAPSSSPGTDGATGGAHAPIIVDVGAQGPVSESDQNPACLSLWADVQISAPLAGSAGGSLSTTTCSPR